MKALKNFSVTKLGNSKLKGTFGGEVTSITIVKVPPIVKPVNPTPDITKALYL